MGSGDAEGSGGPGAALRADPMTAGTVVADWGARECSRVTPTHVTIATIAVATGTSQRTAGALHQPRDGAGGVVRAIAASIAWQCAQSAACTSAADRSPADNVPSIHAASTSGVRWFTDPRLA